MQGYSGIHAASSVNFLLQELLHTKYNVRATPTLIFVDGKTGKVISKDGRSIISDDPLGQKFPWKPKPFSEIIIGKKLLDKEKKDITWDDLKGKVIGLFFSGYWVSFRFSHANCISIISCVTDTLDGQTLHNTYISTQKLNSPDQNLRLI